MVDIQTFVQAVRDCEDGKAVYIGYNVLRRLVPFQQLSLVELLLELLEHVDATADPEYHVESEPEGEEP